MKPSVNSISISFYDRGTWVEQTYKTSDPNWKEVLKLLVANHSQVKINYK
jgi:hypothetical protein